MEGRKEEEGCPECQVPGPTLQTGKLRPRRAQTCPWPPQARAAPWEALIVLRLDEVAAEGDVGVDVVAVDGVLTLTLEEPRPNTVAGCQGQHHTLALHDAAVAGLRVYRMTAASSLCTTCT